MKFTLFFLWCAVLSVQAQNDTVVYRVPGMNQVHVSSRTYKTVGDTTLVADIYYPNSDTASVRRPVAIFVNGIGSLSLHRWVVYQDWARLVAASGMIGITYQTRSGKASGDTDELIAFLRSQAAVLGLDEDRIALWMCSANVTAGLPILMASNRTYIRCGVLYYGWGQVPSFRKDVPILYVRSGLDRAIVNQPIDHFIRQALDAELPLTFINYAEGQHAFDIADNNDESRAIIRQTLDFMKRHLFGERLSENNLTAKQFSLGMFSDTGKAIQAFRQFKREAESSGKDRSWSWIGNDQGLITMAYQWLSEKHIAEAVRLFEEITRLYPNSPNAFDSLGDAYEAAGKNKEAVRSARHALKLLDSVSLSVRSAQAIRQSAEFKINRLHP